MELKKDQWDSLLEQTFGAEQPAESEEPIFEDLSIEEQTVEETPTEVRETPPLEGQVPKKKRLLWPFLVAAALLVAIAVCVLIAYKNRPVPELIKCKEALDEMQARDYFYISQDTYTYTLIRTMYSCNTYIRAGEDRTYSIVDYGDRGRNDDISHTFTVLKNGTKYTRSYIEKDVLTVPPMEFTDDPSPIPIPWPMRFRWDQHNIQLIDAGEYRKSEEYCTFLVTPPESGCDCCGDAFYTLHFLFLDGNLVGITQSVADLYYSSNTYTEHSFSFYQGSEKKCKALIDDILLPPA